MKLSATVSSTTWVQWSLGADDTPGAVQALRDHDYSGSAGSIAIFAGSTEAIISVSTLNDSLKEGDETFKITISNPSNEVELGTASAIGTIVDDDVVATASVESGSAPEGSAVTFKAKLSAAVGSDVVLGWSTGDDNTMGARQATAGTDYTAVSVWDGRVTISANSTEATFTVQTTADTVTEGDETFKVFLHLTETSLPEGVIIRRRASAVGTIQDVDPAPTVSITGVPSAINSTAQLTATFTWSEDVTGFETGDVTVTGGTKGTFSGSGQSYTLAVTPTASTDLTVSVAANSATDGANTGPASAVTATATWDAAAPAVTISGVPSAINSTTALTATFTWSEDVTGFVTGDVTVTGGTAGAFSGSGQSYTLAVTPTDATDLTVSVAADSATDGVGNTGPASAETATATWDEAAGRVTVSVEPASATEGSPVEFKLKLSATVSSTTWVQWSLGADDTPGLSRRCGPMTTAGRAAASRSCPARPRPSSLSRP